MKHTACVCGMGGPGSLGILTLKGLLIHLPPLLALRPCSLVLHFLMKEEPNGPSLPFCFLTCQEYHKKNYQS